jgi:Tfp pilus assembly protein PilN
MNTEKMKLDEMYPGTDAATKRELEGLANAIGQFRAAVHHVAACETESQMDWGFERALKRKQSHQRRVMLEWAVAAVLCVAALVPAVGYYRHAATLKAEQQAQLLKQREADAALLDQVSSEISEAVPDAMQPLAEMDATYASSGSTNGENRNGRN